LKKWGKAFENNTSLTKYRETYEALLQNGIVFPADFENNKYEKYLLNQKITSPIKVRKEENFDFQNLMRTTTFNHDLDPDKYDKKYKKFCQELEGLLSKLLRFNVKK